MTTQPETEAPEGPGDIELLTVQEAAETCSP